MTALLLPLMSLHIGIHWGIVFKRFQRRQFTLSCREAALLRVAAILIAGYGIYVFLRREIGMYMLLKISFVFFDFEEPLILFFLDYLAVMGLWTVIEYYAMKALQKRKDG